MIIVIHAKRFFDGTGAAPVEGATIIVEGNKIAKVGAYGSIDVPTGATVLDMSEHTLTPGLIDSHSHVTVETVGVSPEHVSENDIEQTLHGVARLQKDLRSGVTSMRMVGDRRFTDLSFKNAQAAGLIDLPRLRVSGNLLKPSNVNVSVSEVIADGPDQILRHLRDSIRMGVDWIKFYSTPMSRAAFPTYSLYSRNEVEVIFSEARRAKLPVAVHCHGGEAADWCIELGVDSLEHGIFLEQSQFKALAASRIPLIPTTGVVLLASTKDGSQRLLDTQNLARNYLKEARRWGVHCIPGTDAVHGNLAFELKIMIDCGWSPEEALVAATRDAAKLLRMEQVGTATEGKLADLVAFRGNPLADPEAFRAVDLVIQDGRIVHTTQAGQGF